MTWNLTFDLYIYSRPVTCIIIIDLCIYKKLVLKIQQINFQHIPIHFSGYSYGHGLFNHKPHNLIGCNCTVALQSCLRNVTTSSLAEEVLEVMFGEGESKHNNGFYPSCLVLERRKDNCVKWDSFYHK